MLKTIFLVAFVVVECAFGQYAQMGLCGTDIVGIPNFNINDYAGTWYQIERIDNQYEGACSTTEFRTADDGGLTFKTTQIVNGGLETIEGEANTYPSDGSGKLEHTFHFPCGDSFVSAVLTHYIVVLEPSSYALVMSCDDVNENSRDVYGWKLSRTRTGLTPEATAAIDAAVAASPYLSSAVWEKTYLSEETCEMSKANFGEPSFAYSPDE